HGVPDRWQAHPLARQSFAKSKGLTMIPVGYVGFHPKRKRAIKTGSNAYSASAKSSHFYSH
ncbi:MAG: hypothetical protein WBA58_04350, partial [Giesbergeria sp.]